MSNRIIIVDNQDNPISLKERRTIGYQDIYRVAALWLTDITSGDVLCAQRKWTKRSDPGKWACAAAGTVDEGESYEQNILKETAEEIGLTGITFTTGPKQFVNDGAHQFFCQWFSSSVDRTQVTLKIQKEEVEAIEWIPVKDLIADVQANPDKYTIYTMDALKLIGIIKDDGLRTAQ